MFELEKTFHFEAGHSLAHHDGKCRNPHGHSYILIVHIRAKNLIASGPKTNMVIDFGDLGKIVNPMIVEYLDHRWLNDTLNSESATAEYIAKWIFDYLEPRLPGLSAITLWETASSKVTYTKDEEERE
jgi:6-pyruvoyltetrahydropterin/6-carboxytetrahydropterin synthase